MSAPTVPGNTLGGVGLVALLSFSQTRDHRFPHRDCGPLELTWTEWLFGHSAGHPDLEGKGEAVLNPPVGVEDHVFGPSDAPVTIVQYGDYECPTSRKIYGDLQRVMEGLSPEGEQELPFRYVFRHLPLQLRHPHAEQASVAAEAAARQGAFGDMHEQLFPHQDRLEDEDLRMYAPSIGLDVDQFEDDLQDEALHDRVMADRSAAVQSGVRCTSNLFINGHSYQGAFNPEAIARVVRRRTTEVPMRDGAAAPMPDASQ